MKRNRPRNGQSHRQRQRKKIIFVVIIVLVIAVIATTATILAIGYSEKKEEDNTDLEVTLQGSLESDIATSTESSIEQTTESVIEPVIEPPLEILDYEGEFELPISGASGYAIVGINLRSGPSLESQIRSQIYVGHGFTILEEEGDWLKVDYEGNIGWISMSYCMINLPDVIPSIIYDNTNAYSSIMTSSGKPIPNITGIKIYNATSYNERLGEESYNVAVLYRMAKKIHLAQQLAMSEGNTLIIYEGFRPLTTQERIFYNLSALIEEDEEVRRGVTAQPWGLTWFIAQGVSNHQRGYAIDTSLGRVIEEEERISGNYRYAIISKYEEYEMPTRLHELSSAAASMSSPVNSMNATAWRSVSPASTMNEEALLLQKYCTDAGLTPLASEWWHFNDLESATIVDAIDIEADYPIDKNYSKVP